MYDYPLGLDGKFGPGGRVRVLESSKGDGHFDKATVFLDKIPFPTGITVWHKGLLICAAPDILYAVDLNGDGKADEVKKLFSGFGTENYQGRVNSLEYGLDGWVYGASGLFGGRIKSFTGKVYALGDRDFRIKPDTGELEPATGRTQQGRPRNDWGDWFGCDNSNLCRHYPLADHYLRRNPNAAPPASGINVNDYPEANRLYPIRPLQLFAVGGRGRVTAACGLGIYRDDLLGDEFRGNTFTCEPVSLAVHRLRLSPRGSTFSGRRGRRAALEFLASLDGWFRPVQVRTGPDGCLWVVDMYRLSSSTRADSSRGCRKTRRAGRSQHGPHLPRSSGRMRTANLGASGQARHDWVGRALDSPNRWQRDMVAQMLLWRNDRDAVKPLEKLTTAARPETRVQARAS
jgi:putative membrane-bound dehydrogenase-like protein